MTNKARAEAYLRRDEHGRKCCSRCEAWKSEDQYHTHHAYKDSLFPYCKQCRNFENREKLRQQKQATTQNRLDPVQAVDILELIEKLLNCDTPEKLEMTKLRLEELKRRCKQE